MKELEMLLNQRWILKAEDKELYYRVRDSVGADRISVRTAPGRA